LGIGDGTHGVMSSADEAPLGRSTGCSPENGPASERKSTASLPVGISLSGGGNRAALFGAGAVLATTDAGIHRSVAAVSSVSGGSMLNARLGSQLEWPRADSAQVRAALAPLTQLIASCGFTAPGVVSSLVWFTVIVALGALFVGLWMAVTSGSWMGFWFFAIFWGVAYWAWMMLWVLHTGRQHLVLAPYHRLMIGVTTRLPALKHRSVKHVICATDLETTDHFYFSGAGVDSRAWGLGDGEDVPLSFAVECSAAFPLVFPVKDFKTKKLALDPERKAPSTLKLADGGIHDNLGLPWLEEHVATPQGRQRLIVVNSSWRHPYKRLDRLRTVRIFSVMHESNWSYRASVTGRDFTHNLARDGVARGCVVSIGTSPFTILNELEQLVAAVTTPVADQVRGRVANARAYLEAAELDPESLELLCRRAAGTRTTLGRIEPSLSSELLLHGYLSTAVASHALLGFDLPPREGIGELKGLTESDGALRWRAYMPFGKRIDTGDRAWSPEGRVAQQEER
jgi:hypothetical protein